MPTIVVSGEAVANVRQAQGKGSLSGQNRWPCTEMKGYGSGAEQPARLAREPRSCDVRRSLEPKWPAFAAVGFLQFHDACAYAPAGRCVTAVARAVADIMLANGVGDVIVCNRGGALYAGSERLDADRAALARRTNKRGLRGTADEVLVGADVLLGVSAPGAVSAAAVRRMAPGAIVFVMANPGAFPGVFKGALEVHAQTINEEMKLAAAQATVRDQPVLAVDRSRQQQDGL